MKFSAKYRFARISPRKVRALADMIRGQRAEKALEILQYQPQRGARMLEKALKSALGNAQDPEHPNNRGRSTSIRDLRITDAQVNGGPMFKRIRPRARGMAFMILKRFSHIQITVSDD